MPKSLKSMSLRVAAITIAATFVSVGPYLHYDRVYRNTADSQAVHGPVNHLDLSNLPYIGDIPDFNSIKDTKDKKTAFFDFCARNCVRNTTYRERARILNVSENWRSWL